MQFTGRIRVINISLDQGEEGAPFLALHWGKRRSIRKAPVNLTTFAADWRIKSIRAQKADVQVSVVLIAMGGRE